MTTFAYSLDTAPRAAIGLVALQSDETVEVDMRRLLPAGAELFVTRVPSAPEVTPETLQGMAAHLTGAAALLPASARFAAVGYGCTSGTAQIGPDRIAALVRAGVPTPVVTEPVSALIAACAELGIGRLAFLSPYIESVSARLREVLAAAGIETPVFGSFAEAEEARVARIAAASIVAAAGQLASAGGVDGVFLSCTNLRTLDVIAPLESTLGLPVLSSNLVLGWHLARLAGLQPPATVPGRLFAGGRQAAA